MLESRPEDAQVKLVKTVQTVETVDCWDCRDCSYCSYCLYCSFCSYRSFCLYCSFCSYCFVETVEIEDLKKYESVTYSVTDNLKARDASASKKIVNNPFKSFFWQKSVWKWRHMRWFQIWPPSGVTCISSNLGHHVALRALVVSLASRWSHLHCL